MLSMFTCPYCMGIKNNDKCPINALLRKALQFFLLRVGPILIVLRRNYEDTNGLPRQYLPLTNSRGSVKAQDKSAWIELDRGFRRYGVLPYWRGAAQVFAKSMR